MYALKVFWWVKQACLRWAPPSSFPRDSLSCDIYLVWLSNWLQNEQAWHSSSSKASNYSTREFQQLQVAWQLFLWNSPKKPSQFFLWLVRGSTTSLFAHLFGNHRPSFKIDNQRLVLVVLTHCFQSSSSTATLKAKQVLKMAGFWPIVWQQFCLNYLFESQSSCGSSKNNI